MNIEGHLGGIQNGAVVGWAVDTSGQTDIELEVIFNGTPLGRTKCDLPRPDVKQHLGLSHDKVGFVFRLPPPINLKTGDQVEIRLLQGSTLPGSPYIHSNSTDFESIRYLFLHIPKTAGTSFRTELESALGKKRVFPGSYYLPEFGDRYPTTSVLKRSIIENVGCIDAVVGHYTYRELRELAPKAARLVFLREPVARSISFLRHAKRLWNTSSKSLEEIAGMDTGIPNPQIFNLQTRMLSTSRDLDRLLPSAMSNLNDFEFVGITEHYKKSIRQLNAKLKLRLESSRKLNRNNAINSRISGELRTFIESANREDARLYLHACNLN